MTTQDEADAVAIFAECITMHALNLGMHMGFDLTQVASRVACAMLAQIEHNTQEPRAQIMLKLDSLIDQEIEELHNHNPFAAPGRPDARH